MQRLRQRSDFLAAAAGAKAPRAAFVLQSRERGDEGPPRVGFTVTKKVGTAVERNRVRRRLRDVVRRSAAGRLHAGRDYVLVGRRAAIELPFDRLMKDFLAALVHVHRGRSAAKAPSMPAREPTNGAPAGESTR
jgi:ribonuclease P protein component